MKNYDPPYNTPWPSDESTNYYGGNSGNSYYEGGWIPVDGRPVNLSMLSPCFQKSPLNTQLTFEEAQLVISFLATI